MIKKIYRLRQREVKKVLQRAKPFFSYGIVLNVFENKLNYNRFAIVIGSKSVNIIRAKEVLAPSATAIGTPINIKKKSNPNIKAIVMITLLVFV
jgi:hypothetical protein